MEHDVAVEKNLLIPMRDGARLAADLYRPASGGPWPVLVSCYPYHKDGMIGTSFVAALKGFARHGYAAVLVDCRGTGGSDGASVDALEPIANMDLYDLVEWVASQPWSTGKVGMWGISYGGITALKAASLHPPHLAAIAPIYGVTDFFRTWLVPGGRPNLFGNMGAWMTFMQAMNLAPPLFRDREGRWRALWEARVAAYQPYLMEGLDHLGPDDPYWERTTIDATTITTPTFVIAGWRDVFLNDCIEQFRRIQAPKRLLVGPWVHMLPNISVVEALDHEVELRRWFDHHLKGEESGIMREPAARVYVQGEGGGWRYDDAFPPAATTRTFHLQAEGRLGDAAAEGSDRYEARHTVGVTSGLWSPMPMGIDYPQDQRRDDALALCYTSEPLALALEIAGRPKVRLPVRAPWGDPTLVVKLCDVAPDGSSALVATGWQALADGASGALREIEIALWCTAYRFAPGHRVRISVACGDFPRLWPGRGVGTLEVIRRDAALSLPTVEGERSPNDLPRFEPPDLSALFSEGPIILMPHWRVTSDVVRGTVETRAGLEMKFTTPTGAFLESRHDYVARAGTGERAEPTLDGEFHLHVLQDGDAIAVDAEQHMTDATYEATSSITVNGAERYRRTWQRPWRPS